MVFSLFCGLFSTDELITAYTRAKVPNSFSKRMKLKLVNASYLFTYISYLEKTYTITAQEMSIYYEFIE